MTLQFMSCLLHAMISACLKQYPLELSLYRLISSIKMHLSLIIQHMSSQSVKMLAYCHWWVQSKLLTEMLEALEISLIPSPAAIQTGSSLKQGVAGLEF